MARLDDNPDLVTAVQRLQMKDEAALRDIYRLAGPKIFAVCFHSCRDHAAAEELLHDVVLRIFDKASTYDPTFRDVMAWVITIARNRTIDWHRTNRRHFAVQLDQAPQPVDDAPLASETLLRAERFSLLNICLDTLSEEARRPIRQAFYDGLSYREIARIANVPEGTMKSSIRRTLLRMRTSLKDD